MANHPECVEKLSQSNYGQDDDNFKMQQVKMNRCKYFTTFESEKGTIHLSIEVSSEMA